MSPHSSPKQTAGRMSLLLSITTKQIVACSNRAGSINLFSWSRFQTADVKVLFDVACKEKQNVKLWRHNCWRQQNGLNAVFLTTEIKIKIYLKIILNNYTWIFENRGLAKITTHSTTLQLKAIKLDRSKAD